MSGIGGQEIALGQGRGGAQALVANIEMPVELQSSQGDGEDQVFFITGASSLGKLWEEGRAVKTPQYSTKMGLVMWYLIGPNLEADTACAQTSSHYAMLKHLSCSFLPALLGKKVEYHPLQQIKKPQDLER